MHDDVDTPHRHFEPLRVANVADEIAHRRMLELRILLHFELLEFVARKHDQSLGLKTVENCPDKAAAK